MSESKKINASPTKEFFITMLTRDIGLTRAILDLVDNSVDGAKRDGQNFNQKFIKLTANKEYFSIMDNCGGFSSDIAMKYAFRFGRPKEVEPTPHSVGLFGVGMKRAIFKLGTKFIVESKTAKEHFLIEEDIERWTETSNWEFELNEIEEGELKEAGTLLKIDVLLEQVKEEFEDENFIIKLGNELKEAHIDAINKGLTIHLNGNKLATKDFEVFTSEHLIPGYEEIIFEKESKSPIYVKIITGIHEPRPRDAGWYLFCNDRLVLDADRSFLTGWGEGNGKTVPNYHNDFSRFRGYIFLDSKDPRKLPWNTTKTGVDANDSIFKSLRSKMISDIQPVISFLRELRKEKSNDEIPEPVLQNCLEEAKLEKITSITKPARFTYPDPLKPPKKKKTGRIGYSKPLEQIDAVKEALNVKTYKEVGELTFEYFYQTECN